MTLTTYRNFDLLLTRVGARYKAIVVDAPAGEESVLFDPPFPADALPRLEGLARGAPRHLGAADAPEPAASLAEVGSRLFDAVFGGQVGTLLAASLASVAGEGAGLRLRLRVEADAAELALLPWETLYDPAQGHFVWHDLFAEIIRLTRSPCRLTGKPWAGMSVQEQASRRFYAQSWRYDDRRLRDRCGLRPSRTWQQTVAETLS